MACCYWCAAMHARDRRGTHEAGTAGSFTTSRWSMTSLMSSCSFHVSEKDLQNYAISFLNYEVTTPLRFHSFTAENWDGTVNVVKKIFTSGRCYWSRILHLECPAVCMAPRHIGTPLAIDHWMTKIFHAKFQLLHPKWDKKTEFTAFFREEIHQGKNQVKANIYSI